MDNTDQTERDDHSMVEVKLTIPHCDVRKLQAWMHSDSFEKAEQIRSDNIKVWVESLNLAFTMAEEHDHSGARVFARALASLYNGNRVQFDVSDISLLDVANFEHFINVLRLCHTTRSEPHSFFPNGGQRFEAMIKAWGFEKRRRNV